jgi:hypothetical protein
MTSFENPSNPRTTRGSSFESALELLKKLVEKSRSLTLVDDETGIRSEVSPYHYMVFMKNTDPSSRVTGAMTMMYFPLTDITTSPLDWFTLFDWNLSGLFMETGLENSFMLFHESGWEVRLAKRDSWNEAPSIK